MFSDPLRLDERRRKHPFRSIVFLSRNGSTTSKRKFLLPIQIQQISTASQPASALILLLFFAFPISISCSSSLSQSLSSFGLNSNFTRTPHSLCYPTHPCLCSPAKVHSSAEQTPTNSGKERTDGRRRPSRRRLRLKSFPERGQNEICWQQSNLLQSGHPTISSRLFAECERQAVNQEVRALG